MLGCIRLSTSRCKRNHHYSNHPFGVTDDRSKKEIYKKGITTEFVGEAQENDDAVTAVLNERIQLVYINPESLLGNPRFHSMLLSDSYKTRLRGVVVDEAHCVKLW